MKKEQFFLMGKLCLNLSKCLGILTMLFLSQNELEGQHQCVFDAQSLEPINATMPPPGLCGDVLNYPLTKPADHQYIIRTAFHLVRNSDGTGGYTVAQLETVKNYIDSIFNEHNIYFDYTNCGENEYLIAESDDLISDVSGSFAKYKIPNRLNFFLTPTDKQQGDFSEGFAKLKPFDLDITIHEVGHVLGLLHVWSQGAQAKENVVRVDTGDCECNCNSVVDRVCGTAAYIPQIDIDFDSCLTSDLTTEDNCGFKYALNNPIWKNHMMLADIGEDCVKEFVSGQILRIKWLLENPASVPYYFQEENNPLEPFPCFNNDNVITGTTHWENDHFFDDNIIVHGRLIVDHITVGLTKGHEIIVMPGGKLEAWGSTFTHVDNHCLNQTDITDLDWKGFVFRENSRLLLYDSKVKNTRTCVRSLNLSPNIINYAFFGAIATVFEAPKIAGLPNYLETIIDIQDVDSNSGLQICTVEGNINLLNSNLVVNGSTIGGIFSSNSNITMKDFAGTRNKVKGRIFVSNTNSVSFFATDFTKDFEELDIIVPFNASNIGNLLIEQSSFRLADWVFNGMSQDHVALQLSNIDNLEIDNSEFKFIGPGSQNGVRLLSSVENANSNLITNCVFDGFNAGISAEADFGNDNGGLEFTCNEMINSGEYDFFTNEGLNPMQGNSEIASGNLFSNSSVNGQTGGVDGDFSYNASNNQVTYNYFQLATNQIPTEYVGIQISALDFSNDNCNPGNDVIWDPSTPGLFPFWLYGPFLPPVMFGPIDDHEVSLNDVDNQLDDMLDGGDTPSLMGQFQNYLNANNIKMVIKLANANSPYLSKDIILLLFEYDYLFTEQQMVDILKSNPDVLRLEGIYGVVFNSGSLSANSKSQLNTAQNQVTARTILDRQRNALIKEKHALIRRALTNASRRDTINYEELRTIYSYMNDLPSEIRKVETYVSEGNFASAASHINSTIGLYGSNSKVLNDLADYQDVLNIRRFAKMQGRNESSLTESEQGQLLNIANSGTGFSANYSKNILIHFYGHEFNQTNPRSETQDLNFKKFSFIKTNHSYGLSPNPTSGELMITNVSNDDGFVSLKIYDVKGQKVLESTEQLSSNTRVNITHVEAGVYFYLISDESGQTTQGKIIKLD